LQTERDTFREETKDLNELRIKISTEKNIVQMASKEKITRMEAKIKILEAEVEKLTDYC
jgi:archaellum component FlaC